MNVPPQDRDDLVRLLAFLDRVQVRDSRQRAARRELIAKLRQYDVTPAPDPRNGEQESRGGTPESSRRVQRHHAHHVHHVAAALLIPIAI